METRGNPLKVGRSRQEVTCQLFNREAVKRQAAMKCIDHPIAIEPNVARPIAFITVRVGIPGQVKPPGCHSLAVLLATEQTLHDRCVGLIRSIVKKRLHLLARGRQTGQVQGHPSNQRDLVGRPGRHQVCLLKPLKHKIINLIDGPVAILDLWHHWTLGCIISPMRPAGRFTCTAHPCTAGNQPKKHHHHRHQKTSIFAGLMHGFSNLATANPTTGNHRQENTYRTITLTTYGSNT